MDTLFPYLNTSRYLSAVSGLIKIIIKFLYQAGYQEGLSTVFEKLEKVNVTIDFPELYSVLLET